MPVVISEFEVVPAAPQPRAGGQPAPAGANAEPPALTPADMAELLRRQQERALRISAH